MEEALIEAAAQRVIETTKKQWVSVADGLPANRVIAIGNTDFVGRASIQGRRPSRTGFLMVRSSTSARTARRCTGLAISLLPREKRVAVDLARRVDAKRLLDPAVYAAPCVRPPVTLGKLDIFNRDVRSRLPDRRAP